VVHGVAPHSFTVSSLDPDGARVVTEALGALPLLCAHTRDNGA
jgi:hypothetical protein